MSTSTRASATSAAIHNPGYRFSLQHVSGTLSKSLLLSTFHKFNRKGMEPYLADVVLCFYHAMCKLSEEEQQQMRGSVTCMVTRMAITVTEDGNFLFLSSADRTAVVERLLAARRCATAKQWEACATHQVIILKIQQGGTRGRLGSLARAANEAGVRPANERERDVMMKGSYELTDKIKLASAKSNELHWEPLKMCQEYLPELVPLIDGSTEESKKFAESRELMRHVYAQANAMRLLRAKGTGSMRVDVDTFDPWAFAKPVTMELIRASGAKDQHVLGVKNKAACETFANVGCRVRSDLTPNKDEFSLGGKGYDELEKIYAKVTQQRNERKAKAKKEARRKPKADAVKRAQAGARSNERTRTKQLTLREAVVYQKPQKAPAPGRGPGRG